MKSMPQQIGRNLFGIDPQSYDRYRPDYPQDIFETLVSRCGLKPGISIFEVGPGTGLATRQLLKHAPARLDLIEPDQRMGDFLIANNAEHAKTLHLQTTPFEDAKLQSATYDLGIAAMSFHWVDERVGLEKAAQALKPDAYWAMWWTEYGNAKTPDAFRKATQYVLADLPKSPSASGEGGRRLSGDHSARLAALGEEQRFTNIKVDEFTWDQVMTPESVRGLFSTISPILALQPDQQKQTLDELERIAREEFGGEVRRTMITRLYTAQRKA